MEKQFGLFDLKYIPLKSAQFRIWIQRNSVKYILCVILYAYLGVGSTMAVD